MTITEITKQWQTFYAMLGGATATLLGPLFVSLAIHSNAIHEEENSHFKRLARLTFSNYLMLLMLSFQMLVPIHQPFNWSFRWLASPLSVCFGPFPSGTKGWTILTRAHPF